MAAKRRKKSESAPGWAWMLFGLSIGLGVALVVYLKSGLPPPEPGMALTAARSVPEPPPAEPEAGDTSESQPTADESDTAAQQTLNFYTELRDLEVVVPDGEFDFDAGSRALGNVVIQAGSFPEVRRADARKAELALLGIESEIEPAVVGNERFYRVIIGPLGQDERGRINRILRQLNEREIESFARVVTD